MNKDSFESSKPGLFTSDSTIKSDVGEGGTGAYGLVDCVENMDSLACTFCRDN